MAKPTAKQITIPDHNFACTNCGECCRRWHVYLDASEKARLAALTWPEDAGIPPRLTTRISGNDYIAHKENGACIYLEEATNLCKIHKHFGYDTKPLGCKIYPYTITTNFRGRYSVTGRFDCPAIRANHGPPVRQDLGSIRGYIEEMKLSGGFDEYVLDGLQETAAREITEAIFRRAIGNRELQSALRPAVALMAVERLEIMGSHFLNQTDLGMIFPSFFERVRSDLTHQRIRRLSGVERWRFLCLLSGYLRRDEEIVGRGPGARLKRTLEMFRLFVGEPNLHAFGAEHPNVPISRRRLFREPVANARDIDWQVYLDLVRVRLQAYQFLGPANFGLSYFIGLKTLLLTFPLVVAVAKCAALARGGEECRIEPEDIDYAVGAIDHSFGRSAYLSLGIFTTLSRQMTETPAYLRLLHGLLG